MPFFLNFNRHARVCALGVAMLYFTPPLYADQTASWLDAIRFSGYAKLATSSPNHAPTTVELDDLSLFVSGKFNRWLNPFLEAEAYSIPLWEEGNGTQFNSAQLVIERLYNDIQVTENDTLRAGKFLASINHWNITHAAPLVWTTNRPVTSSYSRANYITGLSLRHEFDALTGHALEIYWQPVEEFNHKTLASQERHYQSVTGARWIAHEDLDYYLGVSFQHANVERSDEIRNSISIDGNWQHKWFELESELLFTQVDTSQFQYRNHDWGGYVQMAVPLIEHFNLIGRYEHFEFANKMAATDTALGGIVYRPVPRLSFKLEWQQTEGSIYHNQTGLYSSIAVLF
ncbi:MAG: hypothetical protein EPN17_12875 [Methylobacter sp.]|nr:MAG: hypothetical protein EPN17_12875 [Methylobacter sp.]